MAKKRTAPEQSKRPRIKLTISPETWKLFLELEKILKEQGYLK